MAEEVKSHNIPPSRQVPILNLLLKSGSKPDAVDDRFMTPLHYFCSIPCQSEDDQTRICDLALLLIPGTPSLDIQDSRKKTCLHYALDSKNFKLFQLLLERGAKVDIPDNTGNTVTFNLKRMCRPLFSMETCPRDLIECFKLSLQVEKIDSTSINIGISELGEAAAAGNLDLVNLILKFQLEKQDFNLKTNTPLHVACSVAGKHDLWEEIILSLCPHFNLNSQDDFGRTPLHCLINSRNFQLEKHKHVVLKLIHEWKASLDILDGNGMTPFTLVLSSGNWELSWELFKLKPKIRFEISPKISSKVQYKKKKSFQVKKVALPASPLHIAAVSGNWEFFLELLRAGADPWYEDPSYNCTALEFSCKKQIDPQSFRTALNLVDVNHQDERNRSLLFNLISGKVQLEYVKILLEFHPDLHLEDNFEETALSECARTGHIEAMKLLLENFKFQHESNLKSLLNAIENSTECAKLLLQHQPQIPNQLMKPAISQCIQKNNPEILREIFKLNSTRPKFVEPILAENVDFINFTFSIRPQDRKHREIRDFNLKQTKELISTFLDLGISRDFFPQLFQEDYGLDFFHPSTWEIYWDLLKFQFPFKKVQLESAAVSYLIENDRFEELIEISPKFHAEILSSYCRLAVQFEKSKILIFFLGMMGKLTCYALTMATNGKIKEISRIANSAINLGLSFLHEVCSQGNFELAQEVCQHATRETLNLKIKNQTPLFLAVRSKNFKLVQLLLNLKVEISTPECSPIILAISQSSQDLVEILLENLPVSEINTPCSLWEGFNLKSEWPVKEATLLHVGVSHGNLKAVRHLLKLGANPNLAMVREISEKIRKEILPIHLALSTRIQLENFNLNDQLEIIQELIQHGSNLNKPDPSGDSIVSMALSRNYFSTCIFMLKPEFQLENKVSASGVPLLHQIVQRLLATLDSTCQELFQVEIQLGNVNQRDKDGKNALYYALDIFNLKFTEKSRDMQLYIVQQLLRHGIDVEKVLKLDEISETPEKTRRKLVEISALNLAAKRGHDHVIPTLLQTCDAGTWTHGTSDGDSWNAFHMAFRYGHENSVKILQEKLGNFQLETPTVGENFGKTPAMLILEGGHEDLIFKLKLEDQFSVRDKIGRNILHYACSSGQKEFLRKFLENSPNSPLITQTDQYEFQPINYAAAFGHWDCARLLLSCNDMTVFDPKILNLFRDVSSSQYFGTNACIVNPDFEYCAFLLMGPSERINFLIKILSSHDTAMVEEIVSRFIPGNLEPIYDIPQFLILAQKKFLNSALFMLKKGLSTSHVDSDGNSILHWAAFHNARHVMQILITDFQLEINLKNQNVNGDTPLSLALAFGYLDLAKYLLQLEPAALDLPNSQGVLPRDIPTFKIQVAMGWKVPINVQWKPASVHGERWISPSNVEDSSSSERLLFSDVDYLTSNQLEISDVESIRKNISQVETELASILGKSVPIHVDKNLISDLIELKFPRNFIGTSLLLGRELHSLRSLCRDLLGQHVVRSQLEEIHFVKSQDENDVGCFMDSQGKLVDKLLISAEGPKTADLSSYLKSYFHLEDLRFLNFINILPRETVWEIYRKFRPEHRRNFQLICKSWRQKARDIEATFEQKPRKVEAPKNADLKFLL
eukprot:TRINITY_DN1958_c1_g1_i4.p1 TRINITY_DN1958_c1_g1~~TRINITY_DN1958_c1_g1_i4.p1  ORF type:complete len:1619 (-),score=712.85 TRINITY_DN1958_c1_g1_i4:88-4944(-)